MDETSMLLGWLAGRRIAAQRRKKNPIAYLYNGIQLPPLPEWDKGEYPFLAMQYWERFSTIPAGYRLFFMPEILYRNDTWGKHSIGIPAGTDHYYMREESGEWVYEKSVAGPAVVVKVEDVKWSNFDILNEDGSVYLAASDPIPVYDS